MGGTVRRDARVAIFNISANRPREDRGVGTLWPAWARTFSGTCGMSTCAAVRGAKRACDSGFIATLYVFLRHAYLHIPFG